MHNGVFIVHGLDDIDGASLPELVRKKVSGVERLTARRGIERGPIEHGRGAAIVLERLRHDRLETAAVRVGVIDAGGHAASAEAAGRSK